MMQEHEHKSIEKNKDVQETVCNQIKTAAYACTPNIGSEKLGSEDEFPFGNAWEIP